MRLGAVREPPEVKGTFSALRKGPGLQRGFHIRGGGRGEGERERDGNEDERERLKTL